MWPTTCVAHVFAPLLLFVRSVHYDAASRPANKCALARILWLLFVGRPLGLALGRTLMVRWVWSVRFVTRGINGYTQGGEKRIPLGK